MRDVLSMFRLRRTPQTERARPEQVRNGAGGFVFEVDDATRLHRFLTLGTEGGTYYASARDLTADNAAAVLRMARADGLAVVRAIVDVSTAGRAPKQNPALFALAMVASVGDDDARAAALAALPSVARTGTHLFVFARYVEQFRGWGRGLRRAVGRWYLDKPIADVAYQAVKYRGREGWTHRDLLRLAHPVTTEPDRRALFEWVVRGVQDPALPAVVTAAEAVQVADVSEAVALVARNPLSWEMLPDRLLGEREVWEALLAKGMPQTALMRQLPRLTRLGLLQGDLGKSVAGRLADPERLLAARVHPVNVLVAQRTYASGRSARGDGEWTPERRIVDALDAAYYAAYRTVEPTRKRLMLALDVSGSMGAGISGMPLTAREASAALALVTAATEDDVTIVGFTGRGIGRWRQRAGLTPLSISPRQRLDDVLRTTANLPFGPTDCALPMLHALEAGLAIDTFVVYTDNETWHGEVHPFQALQRYRDATGIPARLVVVGMTSTGFSIADPTDAGMLDVAGFDSAVPGLIGDFARGQ